MRLVATVVAAGAIVAAILLLTRGDEPELRSFEDPPASAPGAADDADARPGSPRGAETARVLATVKAYETALIEGDGEAACKLLTGKASNSFATAGKRRSCPEGMELVLERGGEAFRRRATRARAGLSAQKVELRGAQAEVPFGDRGPTLELVRRQGEWRVAKLKR